MTWELVGVSFLMMWLLVLSVFVYRMRSHYRRLASRTGRGSIDDVLDGILSKDKKLEVKLEDLEKIVNNLTNDSKGHYQKLGLVRFNPFERIGGDQSFVLALLDTKDCGILLNFLYTREGIRVYAKRVEAGKSSQHELSVEEKEAIKQAN